MSVTTEVVDDEEQHVVTAGSIITVTIGLERQGLDTFMGRVGLTDEEDNDVEELDEEDKDMVDEEESEVEEGHLEWRHWSLSSFKIHSVNSQQSSDTHRCQK